MHQADSVSPTEGAQGRRSAQSGFRPDIEGLRAVAVLAVVLFHAEVPGVGGGFVGVDVFFVISGFLITGLLWREANTTGTVRLRRFYGARARRLLPASATVGVITMIGSAVLLPPLQARTVIGDGIASALYVSNYWFILQGVDYFAATMPPSPFQHYWSLGVEEQFYLVWPALIIGTAWLIRRVRRRTRAEATSSQRPYLVVLALVAAVSFALSLAATYWAPPVAFFSLPTRAWQLAVGGLVALTAGQWRRLPPRPAAIAGWAGLALILLACTRLSAATLYPGIAALLPTLGAALVIGAGCAAPAAGMRPRPGIARRCARSAGSPTRGICGTGRCWCSRRSCSATRWGWPPGWRRPWSPAGWRCSPCVSSRTRCDSPLPIAALPGAVSRWAAPPPRSRSVWAWRCWYVVPTPVGRGAPAAALTVTAAPAPAGSDIDRLRRGGAARVRPSAGRGRGIRRPQSRPVEPQPAACRRGSRTEGLFRNGCMRMLSQVGQPECATGDTASTTTVALVGDSHAAMWNPAFQQIAAQRHWRLETLAKAACPLMDLPITNPFRRR